MKKLDIIKRAFRKLKLSGAGSDPNIPQYFDGLMDLEYMMAEWDKRPSVNTGYNSTGDDADLNEESGLTLGDVNAVSSNLAIKIAADYGLEVPQNVIMEARAGLSDLVKRGATIPTVKYNSRIPRGQGNLYRSDYKYQRAFYNDSPSSSDAEQFNQNDVVNYTVDFTSWLVGNTLASATWESTDNKIGITNQATGTVDTSATLTFSNVGVYEVKVTATDNLGQVTTQTFEFAVNSV